MGSNSETIRLLFLINAIQRVTKKNLVTLNDFITTPALPRIEELMIELFLQRP